MSTVSKKRKLADVATKYYAVRVGHAPGVYMTWKECQESITGFKGSQFKSFTSQQDAEDYMAGKVVIDHSKPQEPKFYAVAVGRVPGVYEDWDSAQEQIKEAKGPKFKRFTTRAEAEEYVRMGGTSSKKPETANGGFSGEPSTKKVKRSLDSSSKSKILRVYTDGSSLRNGQVGALAGVGVFFGDGDKRNVSEPLEGTVQTNQRAELTGILRALELAPKDRDMQIVTDSNYSISCSTVWYRNWAKNGWKTSVGGPVLNKDLVVAIRAQMDQRDARGVKTEFQWIKGHSNDPGNTAADTLAVAGASQRRY